MPPLRLASAHLRLRPRSYIHPRTRVCLYSVCCLSAVGATGSGARIANHVAPTKSRTASPPCPQQIAGGGERGPGPASLLLHEGACSIRQSSGPGPFSISQIRGALAWLQMQHLFTWTLAEMWLASERESSLRWRAQLASLARSIALTGEIYQGKPRSDWNDAALVVRRSPTDSGIRQRAAALLEGLRLSVQQDMLLPKPLNIK